MGGDSRFNSPELESQHRVHHRYFFRIIFFVLHILKKTENKRKEAGDGSFFLKKVCENQCEVEASLSLVIILEINFKCVITSSANWVHSKNLNCQLRN